MMTAASFRNGRRASGRTGEPVFNTVPPLTIARGTPAGTAVNGSPEARDASDAPDLGAIPRFGRDPIRTLRVSTTGLYPRSRLSLDNAKNTANAALHQLNVVCHEPVRGRHTGTKPVATLICPLHTPTEVTLVSKSISSSPQLQNRLTLTVSLTALCLVILGPARASIAAAQTPDADLIFEYTFDADSDGWVAGFADLPADFDQDTYELESGFRALPEGLAGNGFYI